MSSKDTRHRTRCSVCHNRYQGGDVQVLVHERRGRHWVWAWEHRWLCPPCRAAHLDVILGRGRRAASDVAVNQPRRSPALSSRSSS
jgi:hypothetical protein